MRQTRFALSPDKLIMVQATIYASDYSKHVTVDLILDTDISHNCSDHVKNEGKHNF